MKIFQKLLCSSLLTLLLIPAYGQSKKEMESYLKKEWVSAAKTYETGDTIQLLTDKLLLQKKDKMEMNLNGTKQTGSWKYLEDSRILELTIEIEGSSETVSLEIDRSADQVLSLTRRKGDRYLTLIFVEKGSGLVFETVKVPEKSFEEIMAESKAKENTDLGYEPPGEVLRRFDFNLTKEVYENGSGTSGEIGIVYLLDIQNLKKIVIIRGQNGAPEEWDVLNDQNDDEQTRFNCNLPYDYKRGEKIEVNKEGSFKFNESNVLLLEGEGGSKEFTNQE